MFQNIISTKSLAEIIEENKNLVILDVRFDLKDKDLGYQKYCTAHIPRALYADLEKDLSGNKQNGGGRHPLPELSQWKTTIERWGVDNNTQVVVYDDNLSTAARLWWMLRYVGHEKVAVLDGGFTLWQKEQRNVEQKIEQGKKSIFSLKDPLVTTISMTELKKRIANHDFNVIDAREQERYLGIKEPIDPVAGHIPGAKNRFFKDNLKENGQLKSKESIRESFSQIISNEKETVVYCGSGVTACCNLLAMEYSGIHDAKLFVGSWSEWCSDSQNEIATG